MLTVNQKRAVRLTKEDVKEIREGLYYADGDSWFISTVPQLLDEIEKLQDELKEARFRLESLE